jgi:hypothetical protein
MSPVYPLVSLSTTRPCEPRRRLRPLRRNSEIGRRFSAVDLAPQFYPVLSSLWQLGEVLPKTRPAAAGVFRG